MSVQFLQHAGFRIVNNFLLTRETPIWAEAFGIPGATIDYDEIKNHPERVQAFLGFTKRVFSQNTAEGFDWCRRTLFVFFRLWMQGNVRLKSCLDIAGDKMAKTTPTEQATSRFKIQSSPQSMNDLPSIRLRGAARSFERHCQETAALGIRC